MADDIFQRLFAVIEERKQASPDESYTAKLLHAGTGKINKKLVEEAYESAEAALLDDHEHVVYELCDLLFHAFVLAGHKNVSLDEIRTELTRRFGTSGITEKANRGR